jgi:hypothetical protein
MQQARRMLVNENQTAKYPQTGVHLKQRQSSEEDEHKKVGGGGWGARALTSRPARSWGCPRPTTHRPPSPAPSPHACPCVRSARASRLLTCAQIRYNKARAAQWCVHGCKRRCSCSSSCCCFGWSYCCSGSWWQPSLLPPSRSPPGCLRCQERGKGRGWPVPLTLGSGRSLRRTAWPARRCSRCACWARTLVPAGKEASQKENAFSVKTRGSV